MINLQFKTYFKLVFSLFLLLGFLCIIKANEKDNGTNMLIVTFPLRGIYISPNTPGSKVPSHGTLGFGEEYAIDFVMVKDNDWFKKPYRKSLFEYLFRGLQLSDFYGWGQPVYSPVSGKVFEVENNIFERNPVNIFRDYKNTIKVTKDYLANRTPPESITGNFVMIEISEKRFVLLAHLKTSSVKVSVGQKIKEGEIIGELGHSGNSTMPHLHMQIMDSSDYRTAKGLPFVFKSYELKQNNNWVRVNNSVPKVQDILRYNSE